MNQRTTIKDRNILSGFVTEPKDQSGTNDVKQSNNQVVKQSNEPYFERYTVYFSTEQHETLETLKTKLRRQKVKTNKSKLVRVAVDFLASHQIEEIAEIVKRFQT